jgi:hypothetical protein
MINSLIWRCVPKPARVLILVFGAISCLIAFIAINVWLPERYPATALLLVLAIELLVPPIALATLTRIGKNLACLDGLYSRVAVNAAKRYRLIFLSCLLLASATVFYSGRSWLPSLAKQHFSEESYIIDGDWIDGVYEAQTVHFRIKPKVVSVALNYGWLILSVVGLVGVAVVAQKYSQGIGELESTRSGS